MAVNIDWDARRKEIQARAYSENFSGWSGKSAYSKEGVENSSSVLNDKARQLRYSQNTQKTTNNQKTSYTRYLPRTGEELTAGLYNHILANAATDDRYRQKYDGKNYNEIQSILSNLPDGDEKNWLSKYIESDFFDRASSSEIIDIQNKYYSDIENLQKQLDDLRVQNGAYSRGGYAGANLNLGEQISALEQDSALEQEIKNAKDRAEALNPYIVLAQRRENVAEWDKYRTDGNFLRRAHDGATIKNPTIAELDQYAYDIDNATNGRYDEATAQQIINNPVEVKNKLAFFLEHKDDGIDYLNSRPGTYEDIIHKGFMYNWDKLKPEEINMYNYLLATQGEEASDKYLDDIQVLVDKRAYDDQTERTSKAYSEANGLGKLALNIATVPANVIGGAAAFADDVSNIIKYRSINPYSPGHSFQQFSSEVRGLTAQDIEKSIDNDTIAKFASNGYQAVMSGLDSALGSHLLDTKYTITMGMGATSQRAKELYEAGASNGQIMLGSVASGIIEGLFEKVSLDKFAENFLESDIVGLKDFLLKALVQGGIEASEEVNTEISNMIIDAIVMGANSDNEKLVREFMAAGDSEIVARQKAALNAAIEVFWAGYGGFISGGTMAAVRGTPNYLINNSIRNEQNMSLYGDSIQDLINESLELDPNNKLAKKIKSKLDAGKEVKAGEVTRIVNQNNKAITELDISSIQEATANRLTELGETGDVAAIASALTKQAAGQKLSNAEQQAINNSRYGKRVANELNPENINSGDYSSAWAEKIDTSRINVDEYSRLVQDAETATETPTQEATTDNAAVPKATQTTVNPAVNTAPEEVTKTTQSSKPTAAVNETVNNVETPVSSAKDNNVATNENKNKGKSVDVLSEEAQQDLVARYDGKTPSDDYVKAYRALYSAGKVFGDTTSFDVAAKANSSYVSRLGYDTAVSAFNAGLVAASQETQKAPKQQQRILQRGTGTVTNNSTAELTETKKMYQELLGYVAKKTGLSIDLVDKIKVGDTEANGSLTAALMTMTLSENSDNAIAALGHELAEFGEAFAPNELGEIRESLLNWYASTVRAETIDNLIESYRTTYEKAESGKTYDEAKAEVLNDAIGDLLSTDTGIERLVQWARTDSGMTQTEQKTFFEKIKEWLTGMVNALKKLVKDKNLTGNQKALIQMELDHQNMILDKFFDMVDAAAENAGNPDIRYSLKVSQKKGEADGEGYRTDTTDWAYDSYIIDETDRARFYEVIADLNKRGYNVPRTPNGAYIIEHGNKIMFSDGDYKAPTLSKVITVNLDFNAYESYNVEDIKERIIRGAESNTGYRKAIEFFEDLYGIGIIDEYNARSFEADARENGRRKRSDSGKTGKRNPSEVSKYSLKIQQDGEETDTWYSLKITANMKDSERAELLNKKIVSVPIYNGQADRIIKEESTNLISSKRSLAESALLKVAEEFGIYDEGKNIYKNIDLNVEVMFSKGSLKESVHKTITDAEQLAKLMPILRRTIKTAVGIETHDNRYFADDQTNYFHELLGGYIDGDYFIPVRFGIKEFKDGTFNLYVVISQEKIKTEVLESEHVDDSSGDPDSRSVNFKISQIIKEVNSPDLLRYLPDDMLTDIQKKEKYTAIAETLRYTKAKNDKAYAKALLRGDIATAQKIVNAAARASGYSIRAYHGTARSDRVGNVFRPDRATSGPMAFFTDNRGIAENYARDKADTSLAYDDEYLDYYTQFRVNKNSKSVSVPELWRYLTPAERNRIKEHAPHVKFDDDYNEIIYDQTAKHGNGAWDAYTLNAHKGNALEALVDTWLETGDLYGREGDFLDVLKLVGIYDVEYRDPDARHEKVYDVYLNINNPFETATADADFYNRLSGWIENTDISQYVTDTAYADMWDKNSVTPENFLDRLERDLDNNTSNAWTSIPDYVTEFLKEQGYDGIKDSGGKKGGESHTVWIPFSSEQVKSAETVTYDDNGNVISLSERFNPDKVDIRYSLKTDKRLSQLATNRELLAKAAEDVDVSNFSIEEKNALNIYKSNLEKLEKIEARKAEIESNGELSIEDRNRIKVLEGQIKRLNNKLNSFEKTKFLTSVTEKALKLLTEEYGAIKPGEKAARVVEIPKRTNDGNKVSQTVRTAIEASATSDEMAETLKAEIVKGTFTYIPITDQDAKKYADKMLSKGWDNALIEWGRVMNKGRFGKTDVALGFALYNQAVNAGDGKTALRILTDITKRVRSSAQAVQAVRILKQLSPNSSLYALQMSIEGLQETLDEKYGENAPKLEMDSVLVQNYLNAKTDAEKEKAKKALYRDIASQLPNTWLDKWNSWRYLAMLGNARTHIRNIVGNAGFAPVRAVKNIVATGIEAATDKVSGGKIKRTKSIINLASESDRALYKAAFNDYNEVDDLISGAGKYSSAISEIESMKPAFGNSNALWRGMSKIADVNSGLLNLEDVWFSKPAYASALAGYLKVNGITAEQFSSMDADAKDTARSYAIKEAQKATYRDFNAFSDFVAGIGARSRNSNNKVAQAAGIFTEGVLPFRRTPANILVRGIEYSPIGLLNGVKQAVFDVRSGNITAAEAIDTIASGLTGTALVALGALLFASGIIVPGEDDDDKQSKFDDLRGFQNYALNIGSKNITIDWLAPEALPFFVGAEIMKISQEDGQDVSYSTIIESLKRISEPMLEMSMLQSLNDVIDNVSYSDSKLISVLTSAATSYVTQALPTIAGQIERVGEPERETTFIDRNNESITRDIQYLIAKSANKIPGVEYQQIPYIDAWGRHEDAGTVAERIVNNLFNPAYVSKDTSTEFDDELQRLYDAGYENVFPQRVKQSQKIDGNYLTADQYVSYAEIKGSTQHDIVKDIISSGWYADMPDYEKADIIERAYEYANEVGKKAAVKTYELEGWIKDAANAEENGESVAEFIYNHQGRIDSITKHDFVSEHPECADISAKAISDYTEYCKKAGVSAETFYDVWKFKNNNKKDETLNHIDMLDIDSHQKDSLYYALGYAESTINDTPWH